MASAIFLDRDGTLNEDTHNAHKVEHYRLLPGVIEGLTILQKIGFKFVVVTSQSGVGRGYFKEEDVHAFHDHLTRDLEKNGIKIDAYYFCPHHPEEGIGKYKVDCDCRKPKTGMIDMAVKDFGIDAKASYMIGDTDRDIEMGKKAGCTTILVKTGTHKNLLTTQPDYIAQDLRDAASWIAEKEGTA